MKMIRPLSIPLAAGLWLLAACSSSPRAPQAGPPEVLASGLFADKGGQHTGGSFRIERDSGRLFVVLSDDFQTDEGPDLHLLLSPTPSDSAGNDNANVPGAHVLAPLRALSGGQRYPLPPDLSLDSFRSVMIHCVQYSHLYGAAPLR